MDTIPRLVDNLATLRSSWEREPFTSTALGDFDDILSVETVERLIHASLPLSSVRLIRAGQELPTERVARPRRRTGRGRDRLADGDAIAREVADGATLVLEELQIYTAEVAAFAAGLARETGYETDCTAFLTPRRARGVAPHYDPVSVLLRQIHGSKRWRVSAPVRRWPSEPWNPTMRVDTEPVLDVVLKEGESLYIPRGFIHVGETTDEASVHLSISFRAVSWAEALGALLATAATGSESLREFLPPAFADVDRCALFEQRLAQLQTHLTSLRCTDVDPGAFRPPSAAPQRTDLVAALNRGDRTGT